MPPTTTPEGTPAPAPAPAPAPVPTAPAPAPQPPTAAPKPPAPAPSPAATGKRGQRENPAVRPAEKDLEKDPGEQKSNPVTVEDETVGGAKNQDGFAAGADVPWDQLQEHIRNQTRQRATTPPPPPAPPK